MDDDDKKFAERALSHLFVGSQIDGLKFGVEPGAVLIRFHHYSGKDPDDLWLNIESRWTVFSSENLRHPSKEDEIGELTDEESYNLVVQLRREKVAEIRLSDLVPHLLIKFESGQTLFVNGHHDMYECWQAGDGVGYGGTDWLLVAVPGY